MSLFNFRRIRLFGVVLSGAAALAIGVMPALAAPPTSPAAQSIVFDVANPSPGDTVHVGGLTIEGIAFDRQANGGTGIDQVQVFLGDRDAAGTLLAEAPLTSDPTLVDAGEDNVVVVGAETTTDNPNLWHALVTLPSNQTGEHTLYFYAHSAITGAESVLTVPVMINP